MSATQPDQQQSAARCPHCGTPLVHPVAQAAAFHHPDCGVWHDGHCTCEPTPTPNDPSAASDRIASMF